MASQPRTDPYIDDVLSAVRALWTHSPASRHMRLGQLLANLELSRARTHDVFYLPDNYVLTRAQELFPDGPDYPDGSHPLDRPGAVPGPRQRGGVAPKPQTPAGPAPAAVAGPGRA